MLSISLFERELVHYCSPVFARIKPANLICFQKVRFPDFHKDYQKYKAQLKKFSIDMKVLCSCKKRYLVLVYHKDMLETELKKPEIVNIIKNYGYFYDTVERQLLHLTKRLAQSEDFPHEIGLFLGYPVDDVVTFSKKKGEGAILCGYWKVYHNIENAKKIFYEFDNCRDIFENKLFAGVELANLLKMRFMLTA